MKYIKKVLIVLLALYIIIMTILITKLVNKISSEIETINKEVKKTKCEIIELENNLIKNEKIYKIDQGVQYYCNMFIIF